MAHVLVTGIAGFIGDALAQALLARGHRVTGLDRAARFTQRRSDPRIDYVPGDLAHETTYRQLTERDRPDVVLHLAAQTSARISHEQPGEDVDSNARGTLLLADWCARRGVARVLYASTMAVYGEPGRMPVTEATIPAPVSFYGVSKLAGEHYLRASARLGLDITIFRLFNVYGPGQDLANLKQGMASIYLAYLLDGAPIEVTGRLDRFRDFIYIDDVVAAWLLALDNDRSIGRTYNLGSGIPTTVGELLRMLITLCGYDPAEYPVHVQPGHAGDQHGMLSDSSLAMAELNWKPRVPLPDGLSRMVAWARTTGPLSAREP